MIPLPSVDVAAVAAALADGAAFAVVSGAASGPAEPPELGAVRTLRSPLVAPELTRRLVAIRRAARGQLADAGVHTLWLGLGMLVWSDAPAEGDAAAAAAGGEAPAMLRAPLALWPVELVKQPGGGLRLVEAAGVEPRANQALREKLRRELGAVLPDGEAGDGELDLAGLVAAAEAIAAERPGW
ncbi:MAG: DUF4011 domain-containing protein, partial [Deltaproteobacteria bacterium]